MRQKWCEIEPSEGVFGWKFLDTVIGKTAAGGKAVLLRIGTSGGNVALGGNTPGWVFSAVEAELDAGKRIIDATMVAFPKQYVTLAVGGNGHVGAQAGPNLDPDENYLARNAIFTARKTWLGRLVSPRATATVETIAASATSVAVAALRPLHGQLERNC